MTRSVWKGPFADSCMFKPKKGNRWLVWSRRSCIFPQFVGTYAHVYNGKSFVGVKVTDDMVGHKFGEFAATRRTPNKNARTKGAKGGKGGGGGKGGKKGYCTQASMASSSANQHFADSDGFGRRHSLFGTTASVPGRTFFEIQALRWTQRLFYSGWSPQVLHSGQSHPIRRWDNVSSISTAFSSGGESASTLLTSRPQTVSAVVTRFKHALPVQIMEPRGLQMFSAVKT